MGKKLIIKGADFSANALFVREYIMDEVPSEGLTWHAATGDYPAAAWANTSIGTTDCYHPTIYGAKVKCDPGKYVKLFAVKSDGSYRFLQRFDVPNTSTAGAWLTFILDEPATMAAGEYLGVVSNSMYYKENSGGAGFVIVTTDGTGTGVANSTNANVFPFHRIYDYIER